MDSEIQTKPPGTIGGTLIRILGWSLVLGWLPLFGPFIAGFIGGRYARQIRTATAAILPALLWAGIWYWLTGFEIPIKKTDTLKLETLRSLAFATPLALMGGVLFGTEHRPLRFGGPLLLVIAIAVFVPAYRDTTAIWRSFREQQKLEKEIAEYNPERNKTCPENLKGLYNAVMLYTSSWDDTLPPSDRWLTAIRENVTQDKWLHCPEVSTGADEKYGYAMNAALGGKRIKDVKDPADTPLFYDSTELTIDSHDNVTSLPSPGRHTGRNNIVYVDGRVGQK